MWLMNINKIEKKMSKRNNYAVIFDLDGTLIDSNKLIIDSFEYVFNKHFPNLHITKEEYISFIGPTLWESFKRYEKDPEKVDEYVRDYRYHNEAFHDENLSTFEGAHLLLKTLKEKDVKVGIVSSKMHYMVKRGLEVSGLLPYVDVIVGADDVVNHKPHKEPIVKCMSLLNVQEAFYVGDHPNDILSGRNAGIKTIGVSYSWHIEALCLTNPDFMVKCLLDILEVI